MLSLKAWNLKAITLFGLVQANLKDISQACSQINLNFVYEVLMSNSQAGWPIRSNTFPMLCRHVAGAPAGVLFEPSTQNFSQFKVSLLGPSPTKPSATAMPRGRPHL